MSIDAINGVMVVNHVEYSPAVFDGRCQIKQWVVIGHGVAPFFNAFNIQVGTVLVRVFSSQNVNPVPFANQARALGMQNPFGSTYNVSCGNIGCNEKIQVFFFSQGKVILRPGPPEKVRWTGY